MRIIRPHFYTDFHDKAHNFGWWFDDAGKAIPYRSSANDVPANAKGIDRDPFPEKEAAKIALRHFGMIRMERTGLGLRIEWDAQRSDPKAMRSVQALLTSGDFRGPVQLSFRYGGWAHERFSDPLSAHRRISELESYRGETPQTMIAYEDHDVEDLENALPILQTAYGLWSESDHSKLEMFDNPFRKIDPFCLMLSESNASGSLFYRRVGPKAHMVSYLGKEWARDVVGTLSTHGHSDVEFEQVVSEPYFDAIDRNRPHYSHVRALFAIDEAEPDWVSYQRLILPYDTVNGEKAVAIMVAPDQDVSIPFLQDKASGGIER